MPTGVPQIEVVVPGKPWWRSRTLWLNALVLGLVAAEAQLRFLEPMLPGSVYALVAFGLPVLNALLRVLTVAPLALTAQPAVDTDSGYPGRAP